MYAQKYDEEFSRHLPTFVQDIWQLLMTTGHQVKYDLVCISIISFCNELHRCRTRTCATVGFKRKSKFKCTSRKWNTLFALFLLPSS